MAEAARGQEFEHDARAVLTADSKKLLDHVEGGIGRHLQQILLRAGRFALGADGTVVVGQSHRDGEPALRVLIQLEVFELETPEVAFGLTYRLTPRTTETELQESGVWNRRTGIGRGGRRILR